MEDNNILISSTLTAKVSLSFEFKYNNDECDHAVLVEPGNDYMIEYVDNINGVIIAMTIVGRINNITQSDEDKTYYIDILTLFSSVISSVRINSNQVNFISKIGGN